LSEKPEPGAHTGSNTRVCPDCIFVTLVDRESSRSYALDNVQGVFLKVFVAVVTNQLGWPRIAVLLVLSASVEVGETTG